jgi:hypothetical protein
MCSACVLPHRKKPHLQQNCRIDRALLETGDVLDRRTSQPAGRPLSLQVRQSQMCPDTMAWTSETACLQAAASEGQWDIER